MNLNFFTAEFPYGNSETFIENELPYLSDAFDHIHIFSHLQRDYTTKRNIPSNCQLFSLKDFEVTPIGFKNYLNIYYFFILEFFLAPNKKYYLKRGRFWLSLLKKAAQKAVFIEQNNLLEKNAVNYSFWMNDWALVLTFLKKRKVIDHFVFRCGGFDIWNERHKGNYLPFRGLIYKYANKVMPNTILGEEYIKNTGLYPDKVEHSYWGTTDYGVGCFQSQPQLTIVSVSNIIPLKRVNLIVDILEQIKEPIHWIHFGTGELMSELKVYVKKIPQHHVEFKGSVPNKDVMSFYKTNHVDLFITTSSTEGLPVSIQEALSFGVPVIAPNVGGISEMITDENGLLIEKDVDVEKVAAFIKDFKTSTFNTFEKRKQIREGWRNKFEARKVYTDFIENELKKINYG